MIPGVKKEILHFHKEHEEMMEKKLGLKEPAKKLSLKQEERNRIYK